jgi:hypothetical protein
MRRKMLILVNLVVLICLYIFDLKGLFVFFFILLIFFTIISLLLKSLESNLFERDEDESSKKP